MAFQCDFDGPSFGWNLMCNDTRRDHGRAFRWRFDEVEWLPGNEYFFGIKPYNGNGFAMVTKREGLQPTMQEAAM